MIKITQIYGNLWAQNIHHVKKKIDGIVTGYDKLTTTRSRGR